MIIPFNKYDKIFASDLYGLYTGSLSVRHCNHPCKSPAHDLSTDKKRNCNLVILLELHGKFVPVLLIIINQNESSCVDICHDPGISGRIF